MFAWSLELEREVLLRLQEATGWGHRNIVRFLGMAAGPLGGLVLELVHGDHLGVLVPVLQHGRLVPTTVEQRHRLKVGKAKLLIIAGQLFSALAYMAQRSVVHHDLSPANVLVARDPADPGSWNWEAPDFVRVIDFGCARWLTHLFPDPGGHPAARSPERLRQGRAADAREDLWAATLLLVQLASAHFFTEHDLWARAHHNALRYRQLLLEGSNFPLMCTSSTVRSLVDLGLREDRPSAEEMLRFFPGIPHGAVAP